MNGFEKLLNEPLSNQHSKSPPPWHFKIFLRHFPEKMTEFLVFNVDEN